MSEKAKVSCLYCGTTNNFPLDSKGKKVVCGKCKNTLPVPGEVIEPSPEQFAILLKNANLPLLIDFYSPTCAPCHVMNPVLKELAERRTGEIMAMKLNIDTFPQIAARFGIQGVPTFVVFANGNERGRNTGAISETDFSLWVASLT